MRTAEFVSPKHPDKLCDRISDAILDEYYKTQTSYELHDSELDILNSYELKALQQQTFISENISVENMTILDFGCATAYTLNKFKKGGNKLIGFDTSKECSVVAKNKYDIDVYTNFSDITKHRYDLVMLSHVLEHLIDPADVISALCEFMNIGSYIYIEIPYIESFNEFNNEELFGHISFEHLNYFNKTNLTNLMRSIGFKKIELSIKKNDNGIIPNNPVILSLWQLTNEKSNNFDDSKSKLFELYIENEEQKMDAFKERLLKKVYEKKIIIYGTGAHTYRLLALYPELHNNIVGFSDSNSKKFDDDFFFNLACNSIDKFDDKFDAILISSKASENEIYNSLILKTNKEVIRIYE